MELNLLAVGDVVSQRGVDFFRDRLPGLKREFDIHFTVVNGENAAGLGILPRQAEELWQAGADVVTLGNHTWNKQQIIPLLEDVPWLLRPANFSPRTPGRGYGVYDGPRGLRIGVVSLIGRLYLNPVMDDPFAAADRILKEIDADFTVVDFHAEATSEKLAMGWHLDGRAAAVWGTHTHVPTADPKILPRGTGHITDLGMTGPARSILGVEPQQSVDQFLGGLPMRHQAAEGPCKLEGALFTIDTATGRCLAVRRVDLAEQGGKRG